MTNKEAIELLKPLTEYKVNKDGIGTFPIVYTPSQVEALDLAIKALERPQGEWIPISERLPDVSQRYLVYTSYGEVMTDFFVEYKFLQGDVIIAWQPLPEPYKEG